MGNFMTNIIEPDTKFTPQISSNIEPQIDFAHASVILGRSRQAVKELGLKGTMNLGVICEHQSAGASLFGFKVLFDNKFPHIIFVCGKRGSGKSYTLGVIVEELGRSNSGIGSIVIDPLGTFWTMNNKNRSKKAADTLAKYGLFPKDFKNINVLAPIGFYNDMKSSVDGAFSIGIGDLSVDDWCLVFDINRFKTQGLLIGDVLDKIYNGYDAQIGDVTKKIQAKVKGYTIGDIIFCIQHDVGINSTHEGYALATRRSVIARFRSAAKWGIFSVEGTPINEISVKNKITVLDVSHSKLGSSRRALIVGILARKILEARIESSRREEASNMGLEVEGKELIPVTWLVIDEAHLLLPASGSTPATESLIEYAKLGRKPGCGLVFATQRPSATNDDILSQVDTILGHNLALEDDIAALRRRIPAKMPDEFKSSDFIRGIPVGVCLVADQKTQKRTMLVQIRPRLTHHSGKAAMPKPEPPPEELLPGLSEADKDSGELTTGADHDGEIDSDLIPEDGSIGTEVTASSTKKRSEPIDIMQPSEDFSQLIATNDMAEEISDIDHIKTPVTPGRAMELTSEVQDSETSETKMTYDLSRQSSMMGDQPSTLNIEQDLDWGGAYIILTKGSGFVLDIFEKLSGEDTARSLSITRTHPSKLDTKDSLKQMNSYWLSKTPDKNSIPPGNITKLAQIINERLKSNDNSIILLDGLEYLINNNDFPKILKFIETVHENVVLSNGILLLPLNPTAMADKDYELLVSELSNTITDPALGGKTVSEPSRDETSKADEVLADQSILSSAASPSSRTRKPSKMELKDMCAKLGLPTSGTVAELKQRLLDHDSEPDIDMTSPEVAPPGSPGASETEPLADRDSDSDIKKDEIDLIKEMEKERKSLLAERKKLKSELGKLKELEMKRKLEKEKQRLKDERELLEKRKKQLDEQLQNIPPAEPPGSLIQAKPPRSRGISNAKKASKAPKQSRQSRQPKPPEKLTRGKPKPRSTGRAIPGELKQISPLRPKTGARSRKGQMAQVMVGQGEPIADAIIQQPPKELLIKARVTGAAIEEIAYKQLKTKMLGKPVEAIRDIKPVYLPMLRIHMKVMRGSIFAKEYTGTFYWDTLSGEIITDVGSVLKRSKGMAILLRLPPVQAKVLTAVDTWGNNDVVDLQNEIDIPLTQIKRALTELNKKSMVSKEIEKGSRIYNYKRKIELKYPKKFERIKVDMPKIVLGQLGSDILPPHYKLKELEKLLSNLSPGARIVKTENVFYPYFEVRIIGRSGPRIVLLDAVSGAVDKYLTEVFRLQ
jgi:hypothetical protein